MKHTREQIAEMSDAELCQAIAIAQGYTFDGKVWYRRVHDNLEILNNIPSWSTDANVVMTLPKLDEYISRMWFYTDLCIIAFNYEVDGNYEYHELENTSFSRGVSEVWLLQRENE